MARDLGTFIAVILTSDSDNEVVTAARQARKILKAEGRSGNDVAQALEQRGKLLEVARQLKTERDQARAEAARLTGLVKQSQANGTNGFAAQMWQTPGAPLSVSNRTAVWCLDLANQSRCAFSIKETDFLNSCAHRRRLSDAQKDWLEDIVERVTRSTGLTPPP